MQSCATGSLLRTELVVGLILGLAGCSAPDPGKDYDFDKVNDGRAERPSSDLPDDAEDEDEGLDPGGPADKPSTDPPPSDDVDRTGNYKGLLRSSSTVPFSHVDTCKYDVTLKDIAVDVVMNKTGEVVSASVRNVMVERTPGCARPVVPLNNQAYALEAATKTETGWRASLTPAAPNQPKANVTLDLVPTPIGYDGAVTWKRYDSDRSGLNWTVAVRMPLRRQ